MYQIAFTPHGEQELAALPKNIQQRIHKKLCDNSTLPNPLVRARHLVDLPPATHRFRIGQYRVSFFIKVKTIFVERVELRGRAYRR